MGARGSDGGGTRWGPRYRAGGAKVVLGVGIGFILISTMTTFAVHDGRRAAVKNKRQSMGESRRVATQNLLLGPAL